MNKILISAIKMYKKLSFLRQPSCRFYPSCSQYSMEAIQKYGSFMGLIKGFIRIAKCNQLNPGGFDPLK